jgi:hydroxysqualene synthase
MPPVNATAPRALSAVGHYENFPVASWLCPARLRPAVAAIYAFARTADDIADEGNAGADQRLSDLADYRAGLAACITGAIEYRRWPEVFIPLAVAIRHYALPASLLEDLLSAFEQDVARTRDSRGYATREELLDYCRRSANPVGRLLLHLYGVQDAMSLRQSDCICTALQLINFWQDLSIDLPRGRYYVPAEDCGPHGLDPVSPKAWPAHPNARRLVALEADWARELMLEGAALVHRVPGRAGWELRLVVQGGLRILDKIAAGGFNSFRARPQLAALDWPVLSWRALWM